MRRGRGFVYSSSEKGSHRDGAGSSCTTGSARSTDSRSGHQQQQQQSTSSYGRSPLKRKRSPEPLNLSSTGASTGARKRSGIEIYTYMIHVLYTCVIKICIIICGYIIKVAECILSDCFHPHLPFPIPLLSLTFLPPFLFSPSLFIGHHLPYDFYGKGRTYCTQS